MTHQVQYLKNMEHLVVMNVGSIIAQGSYNDLRRSKNISLLENIEENDTHSDVEEELVQTVPKDNVKSLVDQSVQQKQEIGKEQSESGFQVFSILRKYFQYVNSTYFVIFVFALIIVAPLSSTFVSIHIANW